MQNNFEAKKIKDAVKKLNEHTLSPLKIEHVEEMVLDEKVKISTTRKMINWLKSSY